MRYIFYFAAILNIPNPSWDPLPCLLSSQPKAIVINAIRIPPSALPA